MFSNLTPSVSSYSDRTYLDQTHSGQTCLGQTDCEQVSFELPEGLVLDAQIDAQIQTIYRCGQMRLATTADELVAQQATERMDNRAYGILVRLARVVSFADWPIPVSLSPDHLGHLFMSDLQYLIALYNEINPSAYGVSSWGAVGYPLTQLRQEIAFIAFHFHWPRQEILALAHQERQRWVDEIHQLLTQEG